MSSTAGNSLDCLQGLALDVARSAQARADCGQIGVVVAGMRHQLPCAGGKLREQGAQTVAASRMPVPATAMVPSVVAKPSSAINRPEARPEPSQRADLGDAQPRSARRGAHRPLRLKRIAHRANAGRRGGAQHRPQHRGKHVRVLVRVDVGEAQAA